MSSFFYLQKNKKALFENRRGFTMIEILLVAVIIIMVGGFSVPIYQSFQNKNDLGEIAHQISQSLLRAQLLSQASEGDSQWGFSAQSGSAVIFKGVSYAARDVSYDEVFPIPNSIGISGLNEIVFSKVFGLPSATGTLTLTSVTNETKNIIISGKGVIEY